MHVRRLNQWQDERGFQYDEDYFVYDFIANPTTVGGSVGGALAPGAVVTVLVNIEQDSWFEWVSSTFCVANNANEDVPVALPNISVQITDTAAGRNLFSDATPIGLVAGSSQFPYVLPFSRRFKPTTSVIVTFTNFDTANTYKDVVFSMVGRKLFQSDNAPPLRRFSSWNDPDTGRLLSEDYFVYHVLFNTATPAGTSNKVIELIEADSDFEAKLLSCQTEGDSAQGLASAGLPFISYALKDAGTQRELQYLPLPMQCAAGSGGLPFVFPVPRIFLAKTSMQITLYNNSTAAANLGRADFAIAGRKIFEMGMP
jgi:hypothetical protein